MSKIECRGLLDSDVSLYCWSGEDRDIFRAARGSYGGESENPDGERLRGFLAMLLKKGHLVPFEHCSLSFDITAPIFVFRQLFRYRTAIISERSMRYCEAEPVFWVPDVADETRFCYTQSYYAAWGWYEQLLADGETLERARAVLPVAVFSKCHFTVNLRNFLHICEQRLQASAQEETRFIVKRMFVLARHAFPVTMDVFQW